MASFGSVIYYATYDTVLCWEEWATPSPFCHAFLHLRNSPELWGFGSRGCDWLDTTPVRCVCFLVWYAWCPMRFDRLQAGRVCATAAVPYSLFLCLRNVDACLLHTCVCLEDMVKRLRRDQQEKYISDTKSLKNKGVSVGDLWLFQSFRPNTIFSIIPAESFQSSTPNFFRLCRTHYLNYPDQVWTIPVIATEKLIF